MKRVKLTHVRARVSKKINKETIEMLNKISELAYKMTGTIKPKKL